MKSLTLALFLLCVPLSAQSNGLSEAPAAVSNISNEAPADGAGFLDAFYIGQDAAPAAPAGENIFFTLLRVVFVTGILGLLTWAMLRYFFRRNAVAVSSAGSPIEVLSTTPVGLNVFVVVAKLNSQYYLLSLSADGLRLIDKIADKETIDFLEIRKDVPAETKFVDLIENMPEGQTKKAMEFLREKIDRLRKK